MCHFVSQTAVSFMSSGGCAVDMFLFFALGFTSQATYMLFYVVGERLLGLCASEKDCRHSSGLKKALPLFR